MRLPFLLFHDRNRWFLNLFLLLCFCNSSCSIVTKTSFYSPEHKSVWNTLKHKQSVSHFYDTADEAFFYYTGDETRVYKNYEYYYCDTFNSVSVYCAGRISPVLSGLPVIPVLPLFLIPYNSGSVNVQVILKMNDSLDLKDLSGHVHFFFNNSIDSVAPQKILTSVRQQDVKNKLCLGLTTDKYYSIIYSFNARLSRTKKIRLDFDKEFNDKMKSKYETLYLKKKSKFSYWMCVIGAF